jgi:hypothetical protein
VNKFKGVNVLMKPDQYRQVQSVAAAKGLSACAYVRLAIADALNADARKARAA